MAGTTKRGFASMSGEKQREIASKGGRAAHAKGTAHEFSREEAQAAGRKGGLAVSRNREHMANIGRKGGMESGGRTRRQGDSQGEIQGDEQNAVGFESPSVEQQDDTERDDRRLSNERRPSDDWRHPDQR
jgi:general stress protein YciG